MTDFKKRTEQALCRLKNRQELKDEDYQLLIPATERVYEKLIQSSTEDKHDFKHLYGGFVVDAVLVKESVGLRYIRQVLQAGSIECLELTSGVYLPVEQLDAEVQHEADMAVAFYEDDYKETDHDSDNITNACGAFDQRDSTLDEQYQREIRQRIVALGETVEGSGEREFLRDYLDKNTWRGKSKSLSNERNAARISVQKAIKRAVAKLIESPDTQEVGIHLQENLSFGYTVNYSGKWRWNF